jgi:hypothetical protein
VRLSGSRRPKKDDVGRLGDKVELGEMGDRLALDRTLEDEVEVVERIDLGKAPP